MHIQKQFAARLDRLWERRTAQLRAVVIPRGRGGVPKFTREVRTRFIDELLDLATAVLVKRDALSHLRSITDRRRLMLIRGRGYMERGDRLLEWAEKLKGPIVYAFWRKKRCLYVGKGSSPRRLRHYYRSAYLLRATCIEVFPVLRKSCLAQAECLATHIFKPRDQRMNPARVKWGKKCPICEEHDFIRSELKGLFRMR